MPLPRLLVVFAVAAAALVVATAPVGAGPPPSTTTTTTTAPPTTTTAPGPTTTTTPGSTTTTMLPEDFEDPVGEQDAPADEVPVSEVTVPPRPDAGSDGSAYAAEASRIIRRELSVARAAAVETQAAYDAAEARVVDLERKVKAAEQRLVRLSAEHPRAVRRYMLARDAYEQRVADAFIRGNEADLITLLEASDANDFAMRTEFTSSVLEADIGVVDRYVAARRAVRENLLAATGAVEASRADLRIARDRLGELRFRNSDAQFQLAVFAAGSDIVISGFVFPVGDPHSFGNSFGAPRMMGTEYEHAHQGTDILAPFGTPLYAAERGVITRVGTDVLGGTKLWVKGESGTYYYYAHLQAIAEGTVEGKLVEAGETVGYVGDTGNARGGPPHLHFEIHPDGGPAVNPYPLLRVVDDLRALTAGP